MRDIIEVDVSGSYYDQSKVIWDERIDGKMPADADPNMTKVNGKLVVDEALVSESAERQLLDAKMSALVDVDLSNDDVVTAVIGRRDTEYLMAEKQAQAYIDAGYKGDTFPYVDSWAQAKSVDQKWAADNIIETATAWRTIQADMRAKRLHSKEQIRNATAVDQIAAICEQWKQYVDIIKNQLGI
jgi:hypothetical protein